MIKIENTVTPSPAQWEITILGARNAYNSWDRYDSEIKYENVRDSEGYFSMGPNDHKMLMNLCKAGSDHRKFMRMLVVYANITAPLTWWKQEATYQVGAVRNSCSTMHKIAAKEFELDDFSHENIEDFDSIPYSSNALWEPAFKLCLENTIDMLNVARTLYLETKGKDDELAERYWHQMIDLLPESYNQKRTVMYNYEVLRNMYHARKPHRLGEWHELCRWIESLPYSELITGEVKE